MTKDKIYYISLNGYNEKHRLTKSHPNDAGFDISIPIDPQVLKQDNTYRDTTIEYTDANDPSVTKKETCAYDNLVSYILPGETVTLSTGITIELPDNYCALILNKSSIVRIHNVVVTNSPGLIDSEYTGEIKIILTNNSKNMYTLRPYEKIAQILFIKLPEFELIKTNIPEKGPTKRNTRGLGMIDENRIHLEPADWDDWYENEVNRGRWDPQQHLKEENTDPDETTTNNLTENKE